jgi:hypothetical protein
MFESPCSSTKLSNYLLAEPQETSHLPFCIHAVRVLLAILIVPSATDHVGFSIVSQDQGYKGQPLRDHINTSPSIGSNIVSHYGHGSKQCAICPSTFDKFDEPIDHHPDIHSLQSVAAGCPLCALLFNGFSRFALKGPSVIFDDLVYFQHTWRKLSLRRLFFRSINLRTSGLLEEMGAELHCEFSASPHSSIQIDESDGVVPIPSLQT